MKHFVKLVVSIRPSTNFRGYSTSDDCRQNENRHGVFPCLLVYFAEVSRVLWGGYGFITWEKPSTNPSTGSGQVLHACTNIVLIFREFVVPFVDGNSV